MNLKEFFENLDVLDESIPPMLEAYLNWVDKKFGVDYTLRQQKRVSITIGGTVKSVLFIRKTKNYIYVQFKDYPDSLEGFVRNNISDPENVEIIHKNDPQGPICRFRVYNDNDLNVLKKSTEKYL